MIMVTRSPAQTKKQGLLFAKTILREGSQAKAVAIGLRGDLGGGKTTFLQGFAVGLGITDKILSPTFIIMKRFTIRDSEFRNFYHIDCYRLQKPEELLALGFQDLVSHPQNIVAIEWAERVATILPKKTVPIQFLFVDDTKRKIIMPLSYASTKNTSSSR